MASSARRAPGAAARKHLRVLLPFSRDRLRIPDELAEDIGAAEALVVGKVKVWPVEVSREGGGGAFLGRGWPEFAEACGGGAGWFLLLRHRGRGVLTVKAFDDSSCLRDLGTPPPAAEATMISNTARKPQFISVLSKDFMEKMLIPATFVQQYIPREHLNNNMAIILVPHGKVYTIKLDMDGSNMFFEGGWSQFVEFHGIIETDFLLLRYEGNMVFTIKVFGCDGCQRVSKHEEIRSEQTPTSPEGAKQQEAPSGSIGKHNQNDMESLRRTSFYKIVPPSWIKKQMNTKTLQTHLALTTTFCDAIGLREPCMITLKTSMDNTRSWLVHGVPSKTGSYLLVHGWKRFCQENSIKEGDTCTFNVIKTNLWHVVITRCAENMNQLCYETPESHNGRPSSERQARPKGSVTYLKSRSRCVYDIGPPAWVQKEMIASALQNQLNLPLSFCEAIGLRRHCTITLRTSMSGTRSWLARLRPYQNCSHLVGPGWKKFCHENGIRVGDVCTFTIVETNLWHVNITRG